MRARAKKRTSRTVEVIFAEDKIILESDGDILLSIPIDTYELCSPSDWSGLFSSAISTVVRCCYLNTDIEYRYPSM